MIGAPQNETYTLSVCVDMTKRPEPPGAELRAAAPQVVSGQVDVLPTQRRQVLQQVRIHEMALVARERTRGAVEIDRVPQHDGGRYEVQPAGSIALLLEAAVADLTKAPKEHRARQRIARLAFVQASMYAPPELNTLQPVEDEQSSLDTTELTQCER